MEKMAPDIDGSCKYIKLRVYRISSL